MVNYDNTTFKHLQKMNFKSKAIKFVLGYIPKFDTKILEINKNKEGITSVKKCKFTTCVP